MTHVLCPQGLGDPRLNNIKLGLQDIKPDINIPDPVKIRDPKVKFLPARTCMRSKMRMR